MKSYLKYLGLAAAGLALVAPQLSGQISVNENFNSYANDSRLDGGVWNWSVETFNSGGGYIGGYYPGTTNPAGVDNINAILNVAPGDNVLKFYGDYGFAPNFTDNKFVETSIYQQRTLTVGDVAPGTLEMNFDYAGWNLAEGGLDGVSTARAFIKLFASDFSAVYYTDTFNITAAPGNGLVDIAFDGTQNGLILQYGFTVRSQNYSPTAISIDNITVGAAIPEPASYGVIFAALTGLVVATRRRRA
jgi:hypothetical protein